MNLSIEVTPISAAVGTVAYLASALVHAYGIRDPARKLNEIKGILQDIEGILVKLDKLQNEAAVGILPVVQRDPSYKPPAKLSRVLKKYVFILECYLQISLTFPLNSTQMHDAIQ